MPLRHKDSKVHKEMIINSLIFVILWGFVPLGQNYAKVRNQYFNNQLNIFVD